MHYFSVLSLCPFCANFVLVLCFCVFYFVHVLCSFCAFFVPKFGTEFLPFSLKNVCACFAPFLCLFCAVFVPTLCLHFFNHFSKNFIKFIYVFVPLSCLFLCLFCAHSVPILCYFCAFFGLKSIIFSEIFIFSEILCLLCASLCSCLCQVCAYSVLFCTSDNNS
jgi:hypothetical protein